MAKGKNAQRKNVKKPKKGKAAKGRSKLTVERRCTYYDRQKLSV